LTELECEESDGEGDKSDGTLIDDDNDEDGLDLDTMAPSATTVAGTAAIETAATGTIAARTFAPAIPVTATRPLMAAPVNEPLKEGTGVHVRSHGFGTVRVLYIYLIT
jgi:hypothetical protein